MHAMRHVFPRHARGRAGALRGHRKCLATGLEEDGTRGEFHLRASGRHQGRRAGAQVSAGRASPQP